MAEKTFVDRFARLEIPEEKRRLDWSFLDAPLSLPADRPLLSSPLQALLNGRALIPALAPAANGRSILFYAEVHGLDEVLSPGQQEAGYFERNARELAQEQKRFFDSVPAAIVREPLLVSEALRILRDNEPPSDAPIPEENSAVGASAGGHLSPRADRSLLFSQLLGYSRLLRIHGKLYNLLTLKEYARVFEKALDPGFARRLQAFPETATPEEVLGLIEQSLDLIHAKARSPLRNKMKSCRLVFNGVTLLPVYREPAEALFTAHQKLLERRLKADVLARHAGGHA
jgi:hypothetical protein